jgi:hypothetical protein
MDSRWKALAPADRNREYVALLTYLPLKKYRVIPRFLQFSFHIQKQLRGTPGAIGYSVRAKVISRNFWTLSVWVDEKALMDFVAKFPHGEAMKAMAPHMGRSRVTRWKVDGSALPLRWEEAMKRSQQGVQT